MPKKVFFVEFANLKAAFCGQPIKRKAFATPGMKLVESWKTLFLRREKMNSLKLSKGRFGWFILLPYWPFSYSFPKASLARIWAKKEGVKLIRAKHEDRI